jgi:hypothetical protein
MAGRLCAFVFALIVPIGCSTSVAPKGGEKPVVSVTGSVTVNGKPAAGAFVLFIPKAEAAGSKDPRPRGTVADDGTFKLSTYGEDDGAPPGEYWVAITWPANGRDDEDRLGGRYGPASKNRPSATVGAAPTTLPPFSLR